VDFDVVRKTSESRRGNATREADQKLEICASNSGASSKSRDVAQWWSPDAVGINRLVVGSNPTAGAKLPSSGNTRSNPAGRCRLLAAAMNEFLEYG
jgi:hypothetical protein